MKNCFGHYDLLDGCPYGKDEECTDYESCRTQANNNWCEEFFPEYFDED